MKILKIKDKEFKIDDEDFEWLSDLGKWHLTGSNYQYAALSNCKKHQGMTIYLHRLILLAEFGYEKLWDRDYCVDHIDRNPLNCQKSNLRIVTYKENSLNRDNTHYYNTNH